MTRSVAITGRRPKSLPWQDDEYSKRAMSLKNRLKYRLSALIDEGYTTFYVGMAEGVDMYVAKILVELRNIYRHIVVIAVIPYKGFQDKWTKTSQNTFFKLLSLVDEVKVLYDKPSNSAIYLRNKYMVDNADTLLAVYDNIENGGTYNTLKYARSKDKNIIIEEI